MHAISGDTSIRDARLPALSFPETVAKIAEVADPGPVQIGLIPYAETS